jgi:hypothetical protein
VYLDSNFSGDQSVIPMEVTELKERLAVSKPRIQNFDMERFNLNKLNEAQCKKQYQAKSESDSLCLKLE